MEKKTENYIRFDWAMKRLLRNKANFDVLEGFLSSLFNKKVKIQGLLESESNREHKDDKANRVDLLALMDNKAKVIIEVQNNTETAYFQRMIFGTSKVLCDYMSARSIASTSSISPWERAPTTFITARPSSAASTTEIFWN